MSLSPQFLDELRARTSLSALIGRSVSIKKAGREFKGCCPFHNEKTPSFYVNDAKGMAYCFGCSKRVDAISWLTDHGGLQFMDAVRELAAAAGMDVPASDPRQAERDREFESMREIMARAARWFGMKKPGSEQAMDYLEQRGVSPGFAMQFEIGYAPRGRGVPRLIEHMADVPVDMLVKLGLAKRKDEGETYDAFRGRLMFPIHDARGRVIGFGGRIIGEGEPKYLNSPDTPLFDKGRTLFNLHRAAAAARKSNRLILVEGYMDVLALARADIAEVVAPNGTALTEAQIEAAWRLAPEPICCFDGDSAGMKAMARAAIRALPLLEAGKSLAFVSPPAGKDPDDVLRESGAEAVQALFSAPRPLVDVLWAHEKAAEPHDTPERLAGFRARMREHVRSIRNADVRDAYGQDIRARFDRLQGNAPTAALSAHSNVRSQRTVDRPAFKRQAPPASAAQRDIRRDGIGAEIERAVLIGLLRFPECFLHCHSGHFRNPTIAGLIADLGEAAFMNEIASEARMHEEIVRLGRTQIVAQVTAGRPLAYSFARSVPPATAKADLTAAIKAMARK